MGEKGPPPPLPSSHGSKLRGLSSARGGQIQLGVRRPNPEDGFVLDHDTLVTYAVECGYAWHTFGHRRHDGNTTLEERDPTDAETLYHLFPAIIPLALHHPLYGSSAPTLFWTDLGQMMHEKPESPSDFKKRLSNWWRVLNLVRMGLASEALGEPVALVLTGSNWDSQEWSLALDVASSSGVWTMVPRHMACDPQVVLDKDAGYRKIVKLGFAQALYFHALHLLGAKSGELYSPESVVFTKIRKIS